MRIGLIKTWFLPLGTENFKLGTKPTSIPPYGMAPTKLKELRVKLWGLLDWV